MSTRCCCMVLFMNLFIQNVLSISTLTTISFNVHKGVSYAQPFRLNVHEVNSTIKYIVVVAVVLVLLLVYLCVLYRKTCALNYSICMIKIPLYSTPIGILHTIIHFDYMIHKILHGKLHWIHVTSFKYTQNTHSSHSDFIDIVRQIELTSIEIKTQKIIEEIKVKFAITFLWTEKSFFS